MDLWWTYVVWIYGFLCKYSRRFYMLLYGAGVGLNKVPFVHILDSEPLFVSIPDGLLMLFIRGYSVFISSDCSVRFVACIYFIKSLFLMRLRFIVLFVV